MQNISVQYPDDSFSNVRTFGEITFGETEPSSYYITWNGPYGGHGAFLVNFVLHSGTTYPSSADFLHLEDYSSRKYTDFNGELSDRAMEYWTTFDKTYISYFETNAYYTECAIGADIPYYYSGHNWLAINARLRSANLFRTKYIGPYTFVNCVCC